MTDANQPRDAFSPSLWPAYTSALAVAIVVAGQGAPPRRSAVGWMIGSWGARLAVQSAFAPVPTSELPVLRSKLSLLSCCLLFALPAVIASRNPDLDLSMVEIAAAVLWVLAFAGETTADRQRLRAAATVEDGACVSRAGVWRWLPHAHAVFEAVIWSAVALFATASPWGWTAWVCPAVRIYLLTRRC